MGRKGDQPLRGDHPITKKTSPGPKGPGEANHPGARLTPGATHVSLRLPHNGREAYPDYRIDELLD